MKIQILVDNPNSWIVPYAEELNKELLNLKFSSTLHFNHSEITKGDILVMLSCEKIFKDLHLNRNNLVVHESALPHGKGWSPLTWQILEGKNRIPITLFEAKESVDSGEIYLQEFIDFEGHELLTEIKHLQGVKTNELILKFVNNFSNITGTPQKGEESFYPKRGPKDSMLDTSKTIDELFNQFRVCDNERYPAFFIKDGMKYFLKIEKE